MASPARFIEGKVPTKPSEVVEVLLTKTKKPEESETYQRYAQLMTWVDKHRKLRVRTNADQPDQAAAAVPSVRRGSACAAPSTCSSSISTKSAR